MNFAESQRNPGKHSTGLIVVVVLHLGLGYLMVSGLGKRVVEVAHLVEAKTVEAPPPPPPPPPKDLPPPPKLLPPPPVYVPPPPVDVPPPPPQAQIQTTNVMPPPAPEPRLAPPAPPAPTPPAPAVAARPAQINANDPACKPEYPPAAVRAGATGTTRLRMVVDANGKVTSAEIVTSSGPTREHRLMDKTALSALSTCPFKPGIDSEGKPVGTTVTVDYPWSLN